MQIGQIILMSLTREVFKTDEQKYRWALTREILSHADWADYTDVAAALGFKTDEHKNRWALTHEILPHADWADLKK